jgi:TRAP-type uncharacterized transport system substrate-binding protein
MSLFNYTRVVIKDEFRAIRDQFRESKALMIAFLLCLIGIVVYLDPFPDRRIYMGTSYVGSDWYRFGEHASKYLSQKGLDTQVVVTDGAVDNVKRLIDPDDPVNAAFAYGMALDDAERQQIVSLGSVSYEPIWIFYHKDKISSLQGLNELAKYRVGLGPLQSGSYAIGKKLFADYGISVENNKNFIPDAFLNTEQHFLEGKLDVLMMVSTVKDPIVQKLIRTPGIALFDFKNAAAFEKKYNSFEAVRLPAGSINIFPQIPAQDVSLVTTTTSVVVKRQMHPDLQLALLMAIKDVNRNSTHLFFAKRDGFPAYVDPLVPISPVASKFYDYGPPHVMRYLPFWIAGFIDRAWLMLLTLVAIFYPLSKLNLQIRKLRFVVHERPHYEELIQIDALLSSRKLTESEKAEVSKQLDHINKHAINRGVPIGEEIHYFDLMNSIYLLRRKLEIN